MKCEEVDKLLSLYIDDMLDEDIKEDVTSHIDSCNRCREEFYGLKNTLELLKELPEKELPPGFQERLNSRLQVTEIEARPNRMRKNITRGVIAIAATLVIAISIKSGVYDAPKKSMESQDDADVEVKYDRETELAPSEEISEADEDGRGQLERSDEKGAEKQAEDVKKNDIESLQKDGVLTDEVVVKVQDVCANPQAVERMALIHDIEVLDVQEDSIIVEIDTEEKRKLFYDELSKIGMVENVGSDRESHEVRITILPE